MATSKSAASALFLVLTLILCLGSGLGWGTSPSAAAELTAVDKRLFDAVWANDMAAVRRLLGEGANPAAADENGMSAVDVAVDRGYFEIAHYLLAVQNQRRYTTGNPAPAPVVVATPIEPSPAAPAAPAAPLAQQTVAVDPELPDFLTKEKVEFINPDEFLKTGPADATDGADPAESAAPAVPTTADTGSSEPIDLPPRRGGNTEPVPALYQPVRIGRRANGVGRGNQRPGNATPT